MTKTKTKKSLKSLINSFPLYIFILIKHSEYKKNIYVWNILIIGIFNTSNIYLYIQLCRKFFNYGHCGFLKKKNAFIYKRSVYFKIISNNGIIN